MSEQADNQTTQLMMNLARSSDWLSEMLEREAQQHRDRAPYRWEVEQIEDRRTVKVELLSESHFGTAGPLPENLSDAIAWLQGYLAQVPEDCWESATVEIQSVGSYEGGHHVEVTISYNRPETDEEWAARKADVERRMALQDERQRASDLAAVERLRARGVI